jgi:putative oxidoreductase
MKQAIAWVLRLGLGGLFLVTGALKLRDPTAFATDIANYQLLPQLAAQLAAVLPAVEIFAGATLIAAPVGWRRAAAVAVALMMAVFTAAAASALGRGIDISCGCFGSEGGRVDGLTIVRDVVLLAAAGALLIVDREPKLAFK